MNFSNFKLNLLNVIGFFVANPIFAYLLFGVLVLLTLVAAIGSSCDRAAERKDERGKEEIQKTAGKIEILEDQRKEVNKNVKKTENESNRAAANFNVVVNVDSQQRNSDFGAVRRKFCADFPHDSKCR